MNVVESRGSRIPILGVGTMTLKEDLCVRLVEAAGGYRHLDTAQTAEIAKPARPNSPIVSPPQAPKWDT